MSIAIYYSMNEVMLKLPQNRDIVVYCDGIPDGKALPVLPWKVARAEDVGGKIKLTNRGAFPDRELALVFAHAIDQKGWLVGPPMLNAIKSIIDDWNHCDAQASIDALSALLDELAVSHGCGESPGLQIATA
jgi:hypothetical protein